MNPYDSTPTTPTPAAPKRRRWITPTIAIGTLVAGFAIGAGASGVATAEAPEPEVITEVETVTETIEVEVAPAVCLDAINSARAGFGVAADLTRLMGPALEAAAVWDIAGLEAAMDDLEVLNAELNQNMFATEAAACEGAAR